MTLVDRQRSYNGYVLGKPGPWGIVSETGLEDLEVRDGDRPIPRDDGSIPGLHLSASRIVVLRLVTVGDRETIAGNVADLEAATGAMRDSEAEYVFKNPHIPERFVRVRPIKRSKPRTQESEHGPVFVDIALKLADPRIYSTAQHIEELPAFGAVGGGHDIPVVELPVNMTASTQEFGTAVNGGSQDAYPRFVFEHVSGTVSGVLVENLDNGDVLDVTTSIVGGQQLIVDMDALIRASGELVVSIDGSSRYGDWQLPREPFRISPGSNDLKFTVTGGGSLIAITTWRDTY